LALIEEQKKAMKRLTVFFLIFNFLTFLGCERFSRTPPVEEPPQVMPAPEAPPAEFPPAEEPEKRYELDPENAL
jgi:hypothetical protein